MKNILLNLGKRSYKIVIGPDCVKKSGKLLAGLKIGNEAYVITNPLVKNKYGRFLQEALRKSGINCHFKCVADSEKSKSISTAAGIIKDISLLDKEKKIFIIAFGGGVIGDLSGFVASVYKRGTAYIQIPTTLLAQVDSGIGGKTAVDLDSGKNLVGAFHQPRLVLSDTDFLKSLPERQIKAGLAEVIKYALVKDRKLFSFLEGNRAYVFGNKSGVWERIVFSCSLIKSGIVSKDELETKGLRTILNFGHTIGHAIETAGGFKKYNHGEAVALGMVVAAGISKRLKTISAADFTRIKNLIRLYGLPVKLKGVAAEKIIAAHYHDKKFSGKKNKFVLLSAIGRAKVVSAIPLHLIKISLKEIF